MKFPDYIIAVGLAGFVLLVATLLVLFVVWPLADVRQRREEAKQAATGFLVPSQDERMVNR